MDQRASTRNRKLYVLSTNNHLHVRVCVRVTKIYENMQKVTAFQEDVERCSS